MYRRMLDAQVYIERNKQIQKLCLALMKKLNIKCFHTYLAIKKNKEPETQTIIQASWACGRQVLIHKTDFKNRSMSHHTYQTTDKIQVNSYGIPEPLHQDSVSLEDLQAILVPLLVVDKKGNRMGYGKGYYDELLTKISNLKVQKIGLCLGGLVDLIPYVEAHDVALDYCITPHKVYRF